MPNGLWMTGKLSMALTMTLFLPIITPIVLLVYGQCNKTKIIEEPEEINEVPLLEIPYTNNDLEEIVI